MIDVEILQIVSLAIWVLCTGIGIYLWKWNIQIDGYAVPSVILSSHQVLFYLVVLIFTLSPSFVNTWSTVLRLHSGFTWITYLVLIPLLINRKK